MNDIWTPDGHLVLPPGEVRGCLPREYAVGAQAPLFRDYVKPMSLQECDEKWRERRDEGTLRGADDVTKIKNQGRIGSCATEQISQAYEVLCKRMGLPVIEINPWVMYRVTSGGNDNGSSLDRNLKFAREYGFYPNHMWPRYEEGTIKVLHSWNSEPSDWQKVCPTYQLEEYYDIHPNGYVEEIATALVEGFVVGVGWDMHSELMYEYAPTGKGKTANSWGTNWGNKGHHTEFIKNVDLRYGAFAYRTIKQRPLA